MPLQYRVTNRHCLHYFYRGEHKKATFLIAGDMGVYTLPEEAGTSFEDRTMDVEDEPRRRGQRVAAANAGGLAGGWSSGTRGPNSG